MAPGPQPALHCESLVMRKSFSVLLLVALAVSFLLALASARSADLKPVTITGVCAKSTLKEARSRRDVLVAREGARSSLTTSTMTAESVRPEGRTNPDCFDRHDREPKRQGGPDRYRDRMWHHGLTTYEEHGT